mgnify:FL=1
MIIEQFVFTVISLAIFVYMFFKMIKNNDTSYIVILILEAIGIAINFLGFSLFIELNMFLNLLKYVLSIVIPGIVIILEKRGMTLIEIINITRARFYLSMGNDKKAKEALLNLVSKVPDSYKGHKMLAELYEKEGGMRKAIDEYVQAIDINKKDYESYYKVAELLNQLDKKDEATEMLFNLLDKKPDMYKATELLGDILISKEMYKEAVNIYQEALKYNPVSYEIHYNLGIAYTMLNDFQNAKICYEKAANINSLLYNAKYSLAEIALIYKDLEEAEKRFLQAIEEEELSADAYYELAKIYLIKGDKETAINYANTAIDIDARRIVDKIRKEPLFIPVIARVSIPFNLDIQEEKDNKLTQKEIKAKEHLEEMVDITRHLSYNDINLLKKNVKENDTKNIHIENIEKEQDERQK